MDKQRLIQLLSKRNLFTAEFAAELLPLIDDGNHAGLIAALGAMGEALAEQADALADYYTARGNLLDAGQLTANAKLLHAEWKSINELSHP